MVLSGSVVDASHGCEAPVVFTVTFSEDVVGVDDAALFTFTRAGVDHTSALTLTETTANRVYTLAVQLLSLTLYP